MGEYQIIDKIWYVIATATSTTLFQYDMYLDKSVYHIDYFCSSPNVQMLILSKTVETLTIITDNT